MDFLLYYNPFSFSSLVNVEVGSEKAPLRRSRVLSRCDTGSQRPSRGFLVRFVWEKCRENLFPEQIGMIEKGKFVPHCIFTSERIPTQKPQILPDIRSQWYNKDNRCGVFLSPLISLSSELLCSSRCGRLRAVEGASFHLYEVAVGRGSGYISHGGNGYRILRLAYQ